MGDSSHRKSATPTCSENKLMTAQMSPGDEDRMDHKNVVIDLTDENTEILVDNPIEQLGNTSMHQNQVHVNDQLGDKRYADHSQNTTNAANNANRKDKDFQAAAILTELTSVVNNESSRRQCISPKPSSSKYFQNCMPISENHLKQSSRLLAQTVQIYDSNSTSQQAKRCNDGLLLSKPSDKTSSLSESSPNEDSAIVNMIALNELIKQTLSLQMRLVNNVTKGLVNRCVGYPNCVHKSKPCPQNNFLFHPTTINNNIKQDGGNVHNPAAGDGATTGKIIKSPISSDTSAGFSYSKQSYHQEKTFTSRMFHVVHPAGFPATNKSALVENPWLKEPGKRPILENDGMQHENVLIPVKLKAVNNLAPSSTISVHLKDAACNVSVKTLNNQTCNNALPNNTSRGLFHIFPRNTLAQLAPKGSQVTNGNISGQGPAGMSVHTPQKIQQTGSQKDLVENSSIAGIAGNFFIYQRGRRLRKKPETLRIVPPSSLDTDSSNCPKSQFQSVTLTAAQTMDATCNPQTLSTGANHSPKQKAGKQRHRNPKNSKIREALNRKTNNSSCAKQQTAKSAVQQECNENDDQNTDNEVENSSNLTKNQTTAKNAHLAEEMETAALQKEPLALDSGITTISPAPQLEAFTFNASVRHYRCQSVAHFNSFYGLVRSCMKCHNEYIVACGNIAKGTCSINLSAVECPKCWNSNACYCGEPFSDRFIKRL